MNLVLELPTLSDPHSLSTNELLDKIQDLPDHVWFSISELLAPEEMSSSDVAEAEYTRIAMLADQHEIMNTSRMYQPALSTTTVQFAFETQSTDMSSMNLSSIKQFIDKGVKDLIHSGSTKFEGIMIDNGTAKSPSRIIAFMRYCAHTAIVPTIKKIEQAFRGFGN